MHTSIAVNASADEGMNAAAAAAAAAAATAGGGGGGEGGNDVAGVALAREHATMTAREQAVMTPNGSLHADYSAVPTSLDTHTHEFPHLSHTHVLHALRGSQMMSEFGVRDDALGELVLADDSHVQPLIPRAHATAATTQAAIPKTAPAHHTGVDWTQYYRQSMHHMQALQQQHERKSEERLGPSQISGATAETMKALESFKNSLMPIQTQRRAACAPFASASKLATPADDYQAASPQAAAAAEGAAATSASLTAASPQAGRGGGGGGGIQPEGGVYFKGKGIATEGGEIVAQVLELSRVAGRRVEATMAACQVNDHAVRRSQKSALLSLHVGS